MQGTEHLLFSLAKSKQKPRASFAILGRCCEAPQSPAELLTSACHWHASVRQTVLGFARLWLSPTPPPGSLRNAPRQPRHRLGSSPRRNRLIQGATLSMAAFRACGTNPAQLLYKPTTPPEGRANAAPWGRPTGVRWPGCRALQQLPERVEPHLIFCFFCIKAKEGVRSRRREQGICNCA